MEKTADNNIVVIGIPEGVPEGARMEVTDDGRTIKIIEPEGARVKVTDDGRTIKIIFNPKLAITEETDFDIRFPIVPASKLSLEDEFMKYKPETFNQQICMNHLIKAIERGLKDFRVSAVDPSFNDKGEIVYESGNKPALGEFPFWWKDKLNGVMPKKGSQMGTKTRYVAFCGCIIKYLVSIGWGKRRAWKAVCDDSRELGHYKNSEKTKRGFEFTGFRLVGDFYDLANTYKILENDNLDGDEASGFVLAGGSYRDNSNDCPLATLFTVNDPNYNYYYSVGWLVMDV